MNYEHAALTHRYSITDLVYSIYGMLSVRVANLLQGYLFGSNSKCNAWLGQKYVL